MKQEEIINEIIFNKELRNSPLLLSWILESEENRDVYIRYKNSSALMQSGDGMSERQILKDLEAIKKTIGRSKKSLLTHPFFKYAAILTLIIIGSYIYHLTFIDSKPQISMNEISVPEGSRSYITLPDGSEVILVNGSKVTYPSEFIGEAREIYLEGEAYLTVLQNYKSPFKVHLGDHQIEVLGTEFLVTAYPQDDLIIIDLISGKVKMNVAGSTDNTNNMAENRDPRFAATFLYNNCIFGGDVYDSHPDHDDSVDQLTYSKQATRSGYGLRKFFDENFSGDMRNGYGGNLPIIRYAEVLLSYLEAEIEGGNPITQELLDLTINQIRKRESVQMPPITETDPDLLRPLLRKERRIELALEGIRYWDLLRWGILGDVMQGDFWGASFPDAIKTGAKEDPTGNKRWWVDSKKFRKGQDEVWPIPQSEQDINPNLRN